MSNLKPYTVILLYPDYISDGYGEDGLAWVEAVDPEWAVTKARKALSELNELNIRDYDDFKTVAVFEGHLEDLRP